MNADQINIPPEIAETLVDPRAYADNRIHEAYGWLRAHNPLGIAQPAGFDPFWAVVTYADVQFVTRNNELFCNGERSTLIIDQATDALTRQVMGGSPHMARSLVTLDGDEHRRMRLVTQAWFMPANIRRLESRVREIASAAVESMLAKDGRCDFVREVSLRYPLKVVMSALGIPGGDEPFMLALTQQIFRPLDRQIAGQPNAAVNVGRTLQAGFQMLGQYFTALAAERRKTPADDLISLIANASIDGKPLGPIDELLYYVLIAAAGHDTTSAATAAAVWALCERPDEFANLKRDPALIPALVEEAIRWSSPARTFMRTATADTELSGRRISKGDWLMLCFASANRDEGAFPDAAVFRIDRPGQNKHIAFGGGAHMCLGQHLARLQMRILFEELLPRVGSLSLDGVPTMNEAIFVNGPASLPIRFAST